MSETAVRLHVGCGNKRLEGWINVDVEALPEVDVVADVRSGLNFRDAEAVFAEHFLEHLRIDEAMSFLGQAHGCLLIPLDSAGEFFVLFRDDPAWGRCFLKGRSAAAKAGDGRCLLPGISQRACPCSPPADLRTQRAQ